MAAATITLSFPDDDIAEFFKIVMENTPAPAEDEDDAEPGPNDEPTDAEVASGEAADAAISDSDLADIVSDLS